jgi:hypothetical protein
MGEWRGSDLCGRRRPASRELPRRDLTGRRSALTAMVTSDDGAGALVQQTSVVLLGDRVG